MQRETSFGTKAILIVAREYDCDMKWKQKDVRPAKLFTCIDIAKYDNDNVM